MWCVSTPLPPIFPFFFTLLCYFAVSKKCVNFVCVETWCGLFFFFFAQVSRLIFMWTIETHPLSYYNGWRRWRLGKVSSTPPPSCLCFKPWLMSFLKATCFFLFYFSLSQKKKPLIENKVDALEVKMHHCAAWASICTNISCTVLVSKAACWLLLLFYFCSRRCVP